MAPVSNLVTTAGALYELEVYWYEYKVGSRVQAVLANMGEDHNRLKGGKLPAPQRLSHGVGAVITALGIQRPPPATPAPSCDPFTGRSYVEFKEGAVNIPGYYTESSEREDSEGEGSEGSGVSPEIVDVLSGSGIELASTSPILTPRNPPQIPEILAFDNPVGSDSTKISSRGSAPLPPPMGRVLSGRGRGSPPQVGTPASPHMVVTSPAPGVPSKALSALRQMDINPRITSSSGPPLSVGAIGVKVGRRLQFSLEDVARPPPLSPIYRGPLVPGSMDTHADHSSDSEDGKDDVLMAGSREAEDTGGEREEALGVFEKQEPVTTGNGVVPPPAMAGDLVTNGGNVGPAPPSSSVESPTVMRGTEETTAGEEKEGGERGGGEEEGPKKPRRSLRRSARVKRVTAEKIVEEEEKKIRKKEAVANAVVAAARQAAEPASFEGPSSTRSSKRSTLGKTTSFSRGNKRASKLSGTGAVLDEVEGGSVSAKDLLFALNIRDRKPLPPHLRVPPSVNPMGHLLPTADGDPGTPGKSKRIPNPVSKKKSGSRKKGVPSGPKRRVSGRMAAGAQKKKKGTRISARRKAASNQEPESSSSSESSDSSDSSNFSDVDDGEFEVVYPEYLDPQEVNALRIFGGEALSTPEPIPIPTTKKGKAAAAKKKKAELAVAAAAAASGGRRNGRGLVVGDNGLRRVVSERAGVKTMSIGHSHVTTFQVRPRVLRIHNSGEVPLCLSGRVRHKTRLIVRGSILLEELHNLLQTVLPDHSGVPVSRYGSRLGFPHPPSVRPGSVESMAIINDKDVALPDSKDIFSGLSAPGAHPSIIEQRIKLKAFRKTALSNRRSVTKGRGQLLHKTTPHDTYLFSFNGALRCGSPLPRSTASCISLHPQRIALEMVPIVPGLSEFSYRAYVAAGSSVDTSHITKTKSKKSAKKIPPLTVATPMDNPHPFIPAPAWHGGPDTGARDYVVVIRRVVVPSVDPGTSVPRVLPSGPGLVAQADYSNRVLLKHVGALPPKKADEDAIVSLMRRPVAGTQVGRPPARVPAVLPNQKLAA